MSPTSPGPAVAVPVRTPRRPAAPPAARGARAGAGHAVRQVLARRRRARQRARGAGLPRRRRAGRDRPAVPRPRARHVRGAAGRRWRRSSASASTAAPRSPWPAPALCVLLAATVVVRDAEWIVVLCLLAGAAVCVAGLVNGRTLPGVRAGRDRLAARRAARAAVAGSLGARRHRARDAARRRCARSCWSLLGVVVFGLLFASADAVFAEWAGALVPDLRARHVRAAGVRHRRGRRRRAGGDVPRAEPAPRRARRRPGAAGRAPLRVAGPGAARRRASSWCSSPRRPRSSSVGTTTSSAPPASPTPSTSTRASASSPWPPRSPCSSCGRPPARRRARRPRTVAWLRGSLGLLCVLTLVVVASALYRMHVYQEAYGFTRLRLLVDVFEGWLGLLVLGVIAAGVQLRRDLAAPRGAAQRRRRCCSCWPRSTRTPGSRSATSTGTTRPARSTGPTCRGSPTTRCPVLATLPGRRRRVRADGPRRRSTTTGWSGTSAGTAPRTRRPATSPPRPGSGRTLTPAGTNPASG